MLQSLQTVTTNTCETQIPCSSFTSVAFKRQGKCLIDSKRFSVLRRLVRTQAYVKRFISNLKKQNCSSQLTTIEEKQAFIDLIRQSQQHHYSDCIEALLNKSSDTLVRQLGLFLDLQGLLRCKGRLGNSLDFSLEEREPILLAQDDLAKLIVQDCHIRSLHSGVRSTLVLLRNQFWLPNGRKFVSNFVRKCVLCKQVSAKLYCYPDPPALPTCRVNSGNPFSTVGIDYTG